MGHSQEVYKRSSSNHATPAKHKTETMDANPPSHVSPDRPTAETMDANLPSHVSPDRPTAETMDANPPSHVSPDRPTAETMDANPPSHASPDRPTAETMDANPPNHATPGLDRLKTMNTKPSNHTNTTQLTSKCTRKKRKLISQGTQVSNDLKGKYQELYLTIINGERLSDRHIDAANQLLSDKFPNMQGLSTPLLGQKFQYHVYNCFAAAAGLPYIQIIHCPAFEHWITIEISFDEDVRIFDSLFSNKLSFEVKKQIASIIQTKQNKIDLKLEKTQQQRNSTDCGIFAIAFATDLCHGIDPARCSYSDGHELRSHFLKCLQEGSINPFPSKPIAKRKPWQQTIKIYCKCRLPYILEHKKKKK